MTLDERGKKTQPFGLVPKGMGIFAVARQSIVIFSAEMPTFASNNRMTGTAEENLPAVQGSLAFFGPYTFDDTTKSCCVAPDLDLATLNLA